LFPAIAPSLKYQMDYNQEQINLVGTLGNLGGYAGVLPSIFYNVFGPRLTCVLASVMLFGGYILIYFSAKHIIPSNYIIMGLYFMLMGNGTSASYTAALSTNIQNFGQQSRGLVVGILASAYGISSALFSFCYSVFFKKRLDPMLLFLAISTGIVPLISTIFTNVAPPKSMQNQESESLISNSEDPEVPRLNAEYGSSENTINSNKLKRSTVFQEVNPIRILISLDFILLFILFFAGIGAGITMLNNLGSMVISYGGKDGDQGWMVIAFSFANCSGRIISGLLSDKLANYFTRVTVLNVSVLTMGAFLYGFTFASLPVFYPLVIGAGFAYGSIFAMVPSYLSDRFGQKYFAINFSIICLAPTAGSYLLSTVIASKIYQKNSLPGSNRCLGKHCFQLTFIILTAICVTAFIIGLVLMYRSRRLYARIRRYHRENASTGNSSAAH
jgi:MFS family permease